VVAAVVFSGRLTEVATVKRVLWAVLAFILVGAAGYLVNDVMDAERDRAHPQKRLRPVAARELTPVRALTFAALLVLTGLVVSLLLGPAFALVALAYGALTVSYSLALKYLLFVDALAIAGGFVLRALGGAVAAGVHMSVWLAALTGLLAVFVVLVKRRADAREQGFRVVAGYRPAVLDVLIAIAGCACVVAYLIYTLVAANLPADHLMALTTPFVAVGLGRYALLARRGAVPGIARPWSAAPEDVLIGDLIVAVSVVGWLLMTVLILYWLK
jgi:4-hydroxybenzoate polyprenyltransferase